MSFTESTFEQAIIQLFKGMGYIHIYTPDYTAPNMNCKINASNILL